MKKNIAALLFILTSFFLQAKLYRPDQFSFSLNFPEKWLLVKRRSDGIFFRNNQKNAFIEVILYKSDKIDSLEEALDTFSARFRMKGKPSDTTFCQYPALRGTYTFSYQDTHYIMDLVAFKDPDHYYLVFGYAERESYPSKQQELTKIINSFSLYYDNDVVYSHDSRETRNEIKSTLKGARGLTKTEEGPNEVRTTRKEGSDTDYKFSITINNTKKKTFTLSKTDLFDSIDELNQMMKPDFYSYFDIDHEKDPDYQFTFWTRFYREVYNKNYYRVTPIVQYFKEEARKKGWSSYELAENVIRAVQEIPYERPNKIIKTETTSKILDFFTPHQTAWFKKGDCDTKSMLIVLILGRLGYETIIYYSAYYKHAMAGLYINANGTYMKVDNKKYYFIEATYPGWKIGDLPPEMKNTTKWRAIRIQ